MLSLATHQRIATYTRSQAESLDPKLALILAAQPQDYLAAIRRRVITQNTAGQRVDYFALWPGFSPYLQARMEFATILSQPVDLTWLAREVVRYALRQNYGNPYSSLHATQENQLIEEHLRHPEQWAWNRQHLPVLALTRQILGAAA